MARTQAAREPKEWTLMFYFASDNPLAPGIVLQLKALKQAGFHPGANVVVHFDPNEENTPVHIFDVNLVNKLRAGGRERIGFPLSPPSVRNLAEDKLWGRGKKKVIREALREELGDASSAYDPPDTHPKMSGEQNPNEGLRTFLDFCRKNYPARRYMLFILGHGLVTGNNLFLYDEHADVHSLSLKDFGAILRGFRRGLERQGAAFELVSFHCCSMSGLEVAYELQGTANYMLATQGPSFVGNWPYAQIVVSVFHSIKRLAAGRGGEAAVVEELVKKIWSHCYLNSYDYQLVGYSFDLCLCDLNKVREATAPLRRLSAELIKGLSDPLAKERILLAHWDAQSFWQDSYTDLYDFCFRLRQRCADAGALSEEAGARLRAIQEGCEAVLRVLTSGDGRLVVRAEFTGPAYQFSHGLFVYFPWSEPGDARFWDEEYGGYRFRETSWREFLTRYFQETMRQSRGYEQHPSRGFVGQVGLDEMLLDNIRPSRDFNCDAQQLGSRGGFMSARRQGSRKNVPGGGSGSSPINNHPPSTRGPAGERGAQHRSGKKNAPGLTARTGVRAGDPRGGKVTPPDSTGDERGSSSVKNYPPSPSGPVGERVAKQETSKKNAPGIGARTGIRAGDPGKISPPDSGGDGPGTSAVKNYPPAARGSDGGKGAKKEEGKKKSPGVAARTGVRAGDGKVSPPDAGGDGPGTSAVKNYPAFTRAPVAKGRKSGGRARLRSKRQP